MFRILVYFVVPSAIHVIVSAVAAIASAQEELPPKAIYVVNEDGTGLNRFFELPGYMHIGSPVISADGKYMAFDAWKPGENHTQSRVFYMTMDQKELVELGPGNVPGWSFDGHFLTISRVQPSGIWFMTLNGDQETRIDAGWGSQWSPDGKMIAYARGNQLALYDVAAGTRRDLFPAGRTPYLRIYWNMAWSPDGQRICFKAGKASAPTYDVASIEAHDAAARIRVHHSGPDVYADFAWHPQGNRIVFPQRAAESDPYQLYEFDPERDAPPRLMKGQDTTRDNSDLCWSPDGTQLFFVVR
jgi:Tol biopolymer transport system component